MAQSTRKWRKPEMSLSFDDGIGTRESRMGASAVARHERKRRRERARRHVLISFFRAAACLPYFSSGSKNRGSFLSPARHTQKIR